jgi:acetyl esterase/lipase
MTARRAGRGLRVPAAIMRLGAGQLGGRALDPALPWPVQRKRLDQATRIALLPRRTTVTEQTIAGLRAGVVSSRAPGSGLTVIHFHGGGYCLGSAGMAQAWAAHLSVRTGCRVVLPEYRLAPEHPYPAALEDARTVMKTLSGAGPVVVSGDSAGGGLALALILSMRDAGQELPPLLIQAGTEELLAPDAGLLAASASAAGVDVTYTRWPRMWHDFTLQAGLLATADSAVAQASWFVSKVTG